MAHTLVCFKLIRNRGLDPKTLVGTIGNDLFNNASCFYYSRKHSTNLPKGGHLDKFLLTKLFHLNISPYLCSPFKKITKGGIQMLINDSKDCENIDKALKKYKKKFEKSKILLQLRERQSFTKPSVRRRNQVLKAVYRQKIASGKIESYSGCFNLLDSCKVYSFAAIFLCANLVCLQVGL